MRAFEFEEELELERFFADWLVPLQDFLVLATREQSLVRPARLVERYDDRRAERVHPAIRVAARPEPWNGWNVQVARTPNGTAMCRVEVLDGEPERADVVAMAVSTAAGCSTPKRTPSWSRVQPASTVVLRGMLSRPITESRRTCG